MVAFVAFLALVASLIVVKRRGGDLGFFWWACIGFFGTYGLVSVIGLPVFVLAVVIGVVLARRGRGWPESLGVLAGIGGLFIAFAVGGYESASTLEAIGVGLAVLGAAPYWWLRCRPGRSHFSSSAA